MRLLHLLSLFAATVTTATAQAPSFRFIVDSPGPGYRQMRDDLIDESAISPRPAEETILTFYASDLAAAQLVTNDRNMSQIQLVFQPESIQQIRKYIEFNKEKPIRIAIGDYTLPVDIENTLPWTSGVWLEARPNAKAKTIIESLHNKK